MSNLLFGVFFPAQGSIATEKSCQQAFYQAKGIYSACYNPEVNKVYHLLLIHLLQHGQTRPTTVPFDSGNSEEDDVVDIMPEKKKVKRN